MTGAVIAIANRKGGVGKTTTVVSLARTLVALRKRSVVVVDTDPQASASLALVGAALVDDHGTPRIEDILSLREHPGSVDRIRRQQVNLITDQPEVPLSLLACSPRLWEAEDQWSSSASRRKQAESRLREIVEQLRANYDYVLIDTAPGRSFLGARIIALADRFVVPCVPDKISTWGLDLFLKELEGALGSREALKDRVRVLWARFNPASSWKEFAEMYLAANQSVSAFEEGFGSYTSISHGATLDAPASFTNTYPGEVGPRLLRIAESVMEWCGDDAHE
jgi:cellulose biosynthesis protein BcsQ